MRAGNGPLSPVAAVVRRGQEQALMARQKILQAIVKINK
jgi:hypothetical protein